MKSLPKSYPAEGITTIQILQMFGVSDFIINVTYYCQIYPILIKCDICYPLKGVTVVGYGIYYRLFGSEHFAPGTCNNVESNLAFGALIYSTYLYLFVEFAVGKYIFSSSKSSKSKTSSVEQGVVASSSSKPKGE